MGLKCNLIQLILDILENMRYVNERFELVFVRFRKFREPDCCLLFGEGIMRKILFVLAILLVMSSFASADDIWDSGSGMYDEGKEIQELTVIYDDVASDTGLYGNMQINGNQM